MPIAFDPAIKRIILDSASASATEIYSAWKNWAALSDNAKYGEVCGTVGGDDLGGGLFIPPYVFLKNGWRVRPMEANHNLTITGNLFVDGGGVPVVSTLGVYQVNVNYTVPVQAQGIATSGSTGPSAAEIWQYVLENGMSAEEMMRIYLAVLAGKVNGAGTGVEYFRSNADDKDRVISVVDTNGNRTAVIVDGT